MFLVLLKIKNKIHFESLDDHESMIDFIESVEKKHGTIEYQKSIIVSGDDYNIEQCMQMIQDDYYLHIVGRKLDEKVYKQLLQILQNSDLDIKITMGIEFEQNSIDSTNTTEYKFYMQKHPDKIVFSIEKPQHIIKSQYLEHKFDNFDEMLAIFEGFKHDFMEITTHTTPTEFHVSDFITQAYEFVYQKLNMMQWKSITGVTPLSVTNKKTTTHQHYTASEVMHKLRVSDQTLANWRKLNLIQYTKISNRKYLYSVDHVHDILEHGVGIVDKKQNSIIESGVDVTEITDYKTEVVKLLSPLVYRITPHKFKTQNFFFNFGNLKIQSSPQVMISDDFQLVDYIKKNVIKQTPKELYDYIVDVMACGLEPRIDTSKKFNIGFSKLYLNNLYKN